MIVTNVLGGLGNQMFQYALGRHLSAKHETALILDTTGFSSFKLFPYSLRHFHIRGTVAAGERDRLMAACNKYGTVRLENGLGFDPDVLNSPDHTYLSGYWQCEKYFDGVKSLIKADFQVKDKPERDTEIPDDGRAVCIHVRRGDRVNDARTAQIHGTPQIGYFMSCVEAIAQEVGRPHFFLFSDDPGWLPQLSRQTEPFGETTNVYWNGGKEWEDFRLMCQCQHFVMSNSTFSWWAAWLAEQPGSIIYAPKVWNLDQTRNSKDLIPERWRRL